LEALISAAAEHGLKTVVHVGTWEDVRHAVLAGATAVTHVPAGQIVPDDVVSLMAERRTYHIPTLVVHTDLTELLERPELAESPLMAALASDRVRATYGNGLASLSAWARSYAIRQRAIKANVIESVRRLHAAGVPMLTGSDAGNLGVIQGYSVHRELIRLVEAGLSTWDAIAASTTRAGHFLGRNFGVQPGDAANLIVLDASPIDDIANTQRIGMVVLRGRIVYERP
jgi:imidazolonepropionase-like amidohydrolase